LTELFVETDPAEADRLALREKLYAFNLARARPAPHTPLAIFVRDDDGAVRAGIYGFLWGGMLEIDMLYVDEAWRGRGLGRRLVRAMEQAAVARGGRTAILDTFDFQALAFYRREGYEILAELSGYGAGHTKYFLRKTLA
jgi:ribosomal protein S18 acetylase RimI-like enzyme